MLNERQLIEPHHKIEDSVLKSLNLTSGGLRNSLHGNLYQLALLVLVAYRATQNKSIKKFALATEAEEFEKFDDLVFEDDTMITFLQAKHSYKDNESYNLTNLCSDPNGHNNEISLAKYYDSWWLLKNNPLYKQKKLRYIFCSNRRLDIKKELISDIVLNDDIINLSETKEHTCNMRFLVGNEDLDEIKKSIRKYSTALYSQSIVIKIDIDKKKLIKSCAEALIAEFNQKKDQRQNKDLLVLYSLFELSNDLPEFSFKLPVGFINLSNLSGIGEELQKELIKALDVSKKDRFNKWLNDKIFEFPKSWFDFNSAQINITFDDANKILNNKNDIVSIVEITSNKFIFSLSDQHDINFIFSLMSDKSITKSQFSYEELVSPDDNKNYYLKKVKTRLYSYFKAVLEAKTRYEFCLYSSLPQGDVNNIEKNKIYLTNDHQYFVRDSSNQIQTGSLDFDEELETLIKNDEFKRKVLNVTSEKGHTYKMPIVDVTDDDLRKFFSDFIIKMCHPTDLQTYIQKEIFNNEAMAGHELYNKLTEYILCWFSEKKSTVLTAGEIRKFINGSRGELMRFWLLGGTQQYTEEFDQIKKYLTSVVGDISLVFNDLFEFLKKDYSANISIKIICDEDYCGLKLHLYHTILKLIQDDGLKHAEWAYLLLLSKNITILPEIFLGNEMRFAIIQCDSLQQILDHKDILSKIIGNLKPGHKHGVKGSEINRKIVFLFKDGNKNKIKEEIKKIISDVSDESFLESVRLSDQQLNHMMASKKLETMVIDVFGKQQTLSYLLKNKESIFYSPLKSLGLLLSIIAKPLLTTTTQDIIYLKPKLQVYQSIYRLEDILTYALEAQIQLNLNEVIEKTNELKNVKNIFFFKNKEDFIFHLNNKDISTKNLNNFIFIVNDNYNVDLNKAYPRIYWLINGSQNSIDQKIKYFQEQEGNIEVILININPVLAKKLRPIRFIENNDTDEILPYHDNDFLSIENQGLTTVIASDAGTGKSTYLRNLGWEYTNENNQHQPNFGSYGLVIYINLPEITHGDDFERYCLRMFSSYEQSIIKATQEQELKVKLFLDSWDELSYQQRKICGEFISKVSSFFNIDIATRTYATEIPGIKPHRYVKMESFKQCIPDYIKQFFSEKFIDIHKLSENLIPDIIENIKNNIENKQNNFVNALNMYDKKDIETPFEIYQFCHIMSVHYLRLITTDETVNVDISSIINNISKVGLYHKFVLAKLEIFLFKYIGIRFKSDEDKQRKIFNLADKYLTYIEQAAAQEMLEGFPWLNVSAIERHKKEILDVGIVVKIHCRNEQLFFRFLHQIYKEYFCATLLLKSLMYSKNHPYYTYALQVLAKYRFEQKFFNVLRFMQEIITNKEDLIMDGENPSQSMFQNCLFGYNPDLVGVRAQQLKRDLKISCEFLRPRLELTAGMQSEIENSRLDDVRKRLSKIKSNESDCATNLSVNDILVLPRVITPDTQKQYIDILKLLSTSSLFKTCEATAKCFSELLEMNNTQKLKLTNEQKDVIKEALDHLTKYKDTFKVGQHRVRICAIQILFKYFQNSDTNFDALLEIAQSHYFNSPTWMAKLAWSLINNQPIFNQNDQRKCFNLLMQNGDATINEPPNLLDDNFQIALFRALIKSNDLTENANHFNELANNISISEKIKSKIEMLKNRQNNNSSAYLEKLLEKLDDSTVSEIQDDSNMLCQPENDQIATKILIKMSLFLNSPQILLTFKHLLLAKNISLDICKENIISCIMKYNNMALGLLSYLIEENKITLQDVGMLFSCALDKDRTPAFWYKDAGIPMLGLLSDFLCPPVVLYFRAYQKVIGTEKLLAKLLQQHQSTKFDLQLLTMINDYLIEHWPAYNVRLSIFLVNDNIKKILEIAKRNLDEKIAIHVIFWVAYVVGLPVIKFSDNEINIYNSEFNVNFKGHEATSIVDEFEWLSKFIDRDKDEIRASDESVKKPIVPSNPQFLGKTNNDIPKEVVEQLGANPGILSNMDEDVSHIDKKIKLDS